MLFKTRAVLNGMTHFKGWYPPMNQRRDGRLTGEYREGYRPQRPVFSARLAVVPPPTVTVPQDVVARRRGQVIGDDGAVETAIAVAAAVLLAEEKMSPQ